MNQNPWTLILDFDSTIVQVESLDELAIIALESHPDKEIKIQKIKELTNAGMAGEISFEQSLQLRLEILECNNEHVKLLSHKLVQKISQSFLDANDWIKSHSGSIHIFSGGFREAIFPVADYFNIPHQHVHANDFIYSEMGFVDGVYKSNPFSRSGGKVEKAISMNFDTPIVMVGDGNTDAEMKELGSHVTFFAFTENVSREPVLKKADYAVKSFNDVIRFLEGMEALN